MTKKNKVLSIAEILKRKDELKNKVNKTARLYIDSLESEIVIKAPDRQLAFELIAKAQAGDDKADLHAVYECCIEPNLKSKELQEGLGVFAPIDVVDAIFDAGEVASISGHILQLAGFGQGVQKVVDDLKN
jgi:hypothetical protein